jgi:alpha-beta hydrolase superfamily lysophospholipase
MSQSRSCNLWLPSASPARGVVLLTHGLNGLPASLNGLGRALAAKGFEVFRPAFEGHRGDNGAFLSITASEWEQDARRFHAEGAARAQELGVPFHHLAYSMSALIFAALPELRFNRRVLFAPALSLHAWYPAAIAIATLLPWLKFRSRIPEGFSANPVSGMRSARAMHWFRQRWNGAPDGTPTLIWADPRDELVNARALQAMAARSPTWEFRAVSTASCTLPRRFHHLIITEAAVGATEWDRLCAGTAEFLLRGLGGYSSSL